MKGESTTK